ncbi:MAG: hypothetical protein ABIV93_19055 [Byssovorax sp.]
MSAASCSATWFSATLRHRQRSPRRWLAGAGPVDTIGRALQLARLGLHQAHVALLQLGAEEMRGRDP